MSKKPARVTKKDKVKLPEPVAPAPVAKTKPAKAPKWQQPASKATPVAASEVAPVAKVKAARPKPAELDAPHKPKGKPLEPAWHGWPKQERFCLYFHKQDGDFVCYTKFGACYAAKKFIEAVADGADITLGHDGSLHIGERYVVTCPSPATYGNSAKALAPMREIYEHKYTPAELEWNLPVPYNGTAAMMAGRAHPMMAKLEELKAARPDIAPRKAREPRAPRVPGAAGEAKDPFKIKDDMPWDQKVRRMAKKLCADANGGDIALWRNFKQAGERQLKGAK